MKKKLLIFLFLLFILVGCSKTTNTPKGEVQKLFSNYMNLSSDVLIQLDNVIGNEDLTDDEKSLYKDILKKQYQDIKYKIKNEVINEDNAIVSCEVEVYDLRKSIDDADKYLSEHKDEFYENDKYNSTKFWNYKLNLMKNEVSRVNYTIDFTLTKIDNEWQIDELLDTDRQKIHGLYK